MFSSEKTLPKKPKNFLKIFLQLNVVVLEKWKKVFHNMCKKWG